MSVSIYHRLRTERTGGDLEPSWREEGPQLAVALRASGFAMRLPVLAYVLDPRRMRWSRMEVPPPARLAGAATAFAVLLARPTRKG